MRNVMSMFQQDLGNVLQSPVLVLLALAGDEIELEVRHQEPTSWEYPLRSLVVLSSVSISLILLEETHVPSLCKSLIIRIVGIIVISSVL
jgi:hypothetical protein